MVCCRLMDNKRTFGPLPTNSIRLSLGDAAVLHSKNTETSWSIAAAVLKLKAVFLCCI